MSNKKELFLEEAVLDDLSKDFNSLELPLSQKAFKIVGIAVFLIAGAVVLKILFLGGFHNNFYSQLSLVNASRITFSRAERGIIFDRFGNSLVKNLPDFRLNLNLTELFKDGEKRIQTVQSLEQALNLEPNYIENLLKEVDLERQNSLVIARQLSVDDVIKIKNLNLPAVQIENDFKRQYPEGEVLSHIIGYTGAVDKNDVKNNPSLSFNDVVGKSGLEIYYDKELRGEDGKIISYRNVKGETIGDKLLNNPISGRQLYSTIDLGLQSYFFNRLKQTMSYLGSQAGVGIAINPQNGEILSLVSLPSYNNNKIESEVFTNPYKPFFNRAVSGLYSPGSTIKPLVAFAALKENVISTDKQIYSPGYIEIPNPYHPDQPSRFLDWKPQGWVDLYSALARSCDVYFYTVGGGYGDVKGLGINKLKEYWQKFGLDKETGIDLPSENQGFLPDASTKTKDGGIWRIGDTYNVSIGQGDLLVTPIELINYISAIANGGKIYKPFIVKKITDENGNVIKENNPELISDYSSDGGIIKEIQQGMVDTVKKYYGTAYLLADLPVSAAAKTGSAQIENNTKLNAFFVGYSPVENPQIAVLVLVENAREGSLNAVPVAKDVLNWYYYNRMSSH